MSGYKIIKIFLRVAIAIGFLSAVADRFGWWSPAVSVWGNWTNFIEYTALINPWFPKEIMSYIGFAVTFLEVVFGLAILVGFKTEMFAKWSGVLMLIFALSMTFSIGIKAPFDYSVFSASAAAFSLGMMKEKFWELDSLIWKNKRN